MARRPPVGRQLSAFALWPFGIVLTSWHYTWRTTPMRRREVPGDRDEDAPPPLPDGIVRDELQRPDDGVGPLYHRRYRVRVRCATLSPRELVACVARDMNDAAPTEFARFHKLTGDGPMRTGDEYVVHMPGPWNGPVRVLEVTETSFRLATLDGHLEAGQIEFRAREDGELVFEIESWTRSGDRVSNLLYAHLRMAKEIQLHMWTSFLERIVEIAGGRRAEAIEIDTRRVEA